MAHVGRLIVYSLTHVFTFFTIEHRQFLELVFYSESDTLFAMTTDDAIAKNYG